jgi:hypothetical protein
MTELARWSTRSGLAGPPNGTSPRCRARRGVGRDLGATRPCVAMDLAWSLDTGSDRLNRSRGAGR